MSWGCCHKVLQTGWLRASPFPPGPGGQMSETQASARLVPSGALGEGPVCAFFLASGIYQ